MGFSGLVAETFLIRELLIAFSGNELSIGIILANWLVLEALGASLLGQGIGKAWSGASAFAAVTLLFCAALPAAIFSARLLRNALGLSIGEPIGLWPIVYTSFLILSPVSTLHGAQFPLACQMGEAFGGEGASAAGKVYAYETVGTVIGGLVCTYLLIPRLDSFQAASLAGAVNLAASLVLLAAARRGGEPRPRVLFAAVGLFLLFFLALTSQADKLHRRSIQLQWRHFTVLRYRNSPYGNLCVVENESQYIFFQDGVPTLITPIPDIPFVEEFVHLPLLAHAEPRRVLIVSGGAGGVIHEVLKHPSIEAVEYVELDPALIELFQEFPTPLTQRELDDPRVQVRRTDGRLWLQLTPNRYDVIWVGITEPSTLQTNRFFTQEFFRLAREKLNAGGILVVGLPGSLTYLSDELKDLNSSILHTLRSVFPYIRAIPGDGTNLFLASAATDVLAVDRERVIGRLKERNIQAEVLIPWHIEQKLHPGWQEWFAEFIEGGSRELNSDFRPIGVFYSIAHWNARFAPALRGFFRLAQRMRGWMAVPLVAALLLVYLRLRKGWAALAGSAVPLAVATSGFAGMLFHLIIVFVFQAVYGYVFAWIGLLVAAFMSGAAGGALLATRGLGRLRDAGCLWLFAALELVIAGFSLLCPVLFSVVKDAVVSPRGFWTLQVLILGIAGVGGGLIGAQYPLANRIYLKEKANVREVAGLLYACDLLGGWLGGMFGGMVLLPVLGLTATCAVVGLLKAASFSAVATQPRAVRRSER